MADDFYPVKNTPNKPSEGLNTQTEKNLSNTDGNLYQPSHNGVWMRQSSSDPNNQINLSGRQQSQAIANKRFGFINNAVRSLIRPANSFDGDIRSPLPPELTSEYEQSQVHIIEQKTKPYWESGEDALDDWNQDQSEGYHGEDYGTEQASGYYQDDYYNYQKSYKKKGLSVKIDRFVQRFPALGKLYKQPPSSFDKYEFDQQFKYNQRSDLANSNQLARELTVDELSLNGRYSDKTRIQFINLQTKDQKQSQPVDVRIHHETNKIYLCDIGRSIVEIYDINGTFQHIIDDSIMTKFQPTAIAVAFDESIIVASHFNHCLHMYSPNNPQNAVNFYSYKQYKLGASGNQIHQFYNPAGIAIDNNDGYLYVCDRGNYRIQVISPEGICERVIELFLNCKKKYQVDPVRVAHQQNLDQIVCIIGPGDAICFIPKFSNGRIYVDPLYIFDENGLGLDGASGLAVDNNDRIFISDTGHHRIVICTSEGSYITSFGTQGDGLCELKRPCGLDITKNGTIVVTDPGNKRLQLFGLIREQIFVENNPLKENFNDQELDLVDYSI